MKESGPAWQPALQFMASKPQEPAALMRQTKRRVETEVLAPAEQQARSGGSRHNCRQQVAARGRTWAALFTAHDSGVLPQPSRASTSAPQPRSRWTVAVLPHQSAAWCSGRWLSKLCAFTSAPCSISRCIIRLAIASAAASTSDRACRVVQLARRSPTPGGQPSARGTRPASVSRALRPHAARCDHACTEGRGL